MADGHGSKPHETVALVGLAGLAGAAGVTWLAGATAIRLSGHHLPPHHQLAGLAALAHRSDPAKAWGVPVGPVAVYWTLTAVYAAAALALVWVGWRVLRSARRQPQTKPHDRLAGLADRKHVLQHAGARRLSATAPLLRPSLRKATPADVGHRMGRSQGADVWSSVEDSTIVVGPPRAGKGLHLVIPRILDHRGPVITTSTRPDNLAVTMKARARRSPSRRVRPATSRPGHPVGYQVVASPRAASESRPPWPGPPGWYRTRLDRQRTTPSGGTGPGTWSAASSTPPPSATVPLPTSTGGACRPTWPSRRSPS